MGGVEAVRGVGAAHPHKRPTGHPQATPRTLDGHHGVGLGHRRCGRCRRGGGSLHRPTQVVPSRGRAGGHHRRGVTPQEAHNVALQHTPVLPSAHNLRVNVCGGGVNKGETAAGIVEGGGRVGVCAPHGLMHPATHHTTLNNCATARTFEMSTLASRDSRRTAGDARALPRAALSDTPGSHRARAHDTTRHDTT
jgi:hypothetical protein